MQVGYIDPYGGEIIRISETGNLVMWYYANTERYGVYLYKRPIQSWDQEWLLYAIRGQKESADFIFDNVIDILV